MIHTSKALIVLILFFFAAVFSCTLSPETQAISHTVKTEPRIELGEAIIYRDTWGVPHIYAKSIEDGLFAMGWAQAQDRPKELLLNMLRGRGELSQVEGVDAINSDKIALMWNLYQGTKELKDNIHPEVRKHVQALVRGINHYYRTHSQDVPLWWKNRLVDEFMVYAYSRMFLQSYAFDDGLRDLKRGGINPDIQPMSRFSNQFVLSPERTKDNAAILVSDLHLPWHGASHFWEFRIHAGKLKGSGFTLPGMPYIGLGHNENTAWAMTTGGPDCTDVYELTLNTQDNEPTKYLYNKQWRDLKLRRYEINVKGIGQTAVRFFDSHLGPIAAIKDGKGYAIRSSYAKEVNALLPWHDFSFASSIDEIKKGLGALQLFPHNLMAADDSGNIYYQRTGRVPKRPEGYDWSKPVDGTTSDSEWLGIHPVSDLLQVTNPTQGYMQNCNVPPDAMMVNSPFKLENTLSYIFADLTQSEALGYPTIDGWITSRGSRVVELLKNEKRTTIERVMAIANDIRPYSAHRWVESLIKANDYFRSNYEDNRSYNSAIKEMKSWNFELAANSKAALKYVYWRAQLRKNLGWAGMKKLSKKIDYLLEPLRETKTTVNLSRGELQLLASSFAEGLSKLETDLGTTDKTYGDVFRIARGNNSWPSEGGMAYSIGLTTVRSVHYGNTRPDNTRWAQGGQTSTTVVLLTKPVQSWTSVPFGQSNRSGSPHFSDQAEELFSKRKMKSSWWTFDELEKHIESVTTIEIPKDQ